METPQFVNEEIPVKKNQTPLIIAIVAIVLCCCCLVIVIAGYYGYNTIRSTETQIQPLEEATPIYQAPSTDNDYEAPAVDAGVGEAPTGGLGNDILRYDTWNYVGFVAVGLGCDEPVGADSTIDVLQEPAGGVWVEEWTVACASGDTYPFEIEFILDDTGATFNITSMP